MDFLTALRKLNNREANRIRLPSWHKTYLKLSQTNPNYLENDSGQNTFSNITLMLLDNWIAYNKKEE